MRKRLTSLQRVRIFDAASGVCAICGLKIQVGQRWHVDHEIPLWLSGGDSRENMRPVHDICHTIKTIREASARAKGDRVRAKHIGADKRKRPMPGSRASPWKRRMDGTIVRRR